MPQTQIETPADLDRPNQRRHDIDWLRVIAIAALLFYHSVVSFQPWAVYLAIIAHKDTIDGLWSVAAALNTWRIPLLFTLSGMGVYLAMGKRNWAGVLRERTRRILVPLIFGTAAIVPVNMLLFQSYYDQDLAYFPHPHHLWFLGNIFLYILILLPLLHYLTHATAIRERLLRLWPTATIYTLLIPLVLVSGWINPENYNFYAMTLHGFMLGLFVFIYGFAFLWLGDTLRPTIRRLCWLNLSLGLALYCSRLLIFDYHILPALGSLETYVWILGILGIADRYLNRPSPLLSWLTRAAYPVYIVHFTFLFIAAHALYPLDIPPWLAFVGATLLCYLGSLAFYCLVIAPLPPLQVLFGLNKAPASHAPKQQA